MAFAFSKSLRSLDDDDDMEDFLSSILNDSGKKDKKKGGNDSHVAESKQEITQLTSFKQDASKSKDDDDEFDKILDSRRKTSATDFGKINGDQKSDPLARPPTRSGSRTVTAAEKDGLDDIINSMGLGSPKKESGTQANRNAKGRSLVAPIGSTTTNSRKTLDTLLLDSDSFDDGPKAETKPAAKKEDFSFGGYTPSAAGKPANKRLVRFRSNEKSLGDEEDDDDDNQLLRTAPAMLTRDNRNEEPDWLTDVGVGLGRANPKEGEGGRPRTVDSAGITRDDSFDFGDFLGGMSSKKRPGGNPRRKSSEFGAESMESPRRRSVVNVLRLDGSDENNNDNAYKRGGLDFLKGFGDDDGDGDKNNSANKRRDDDRAVKGAKETKTNKVKSSIQVSQSEMNQVKLLEADKEFLLEKIERMKQQHEEEKRLIEEAFSKRVRLAEETFEKCQERLKQENEILSQDILEKVRALEKEKSEMFASHLERMKRMETERTEEVEKLRNDYRMMMDGMRQEHEESLQRILKTKNRELDVVISSKDHVKKLETALTYLEVNTADLDDLRNKVRSKADGAELDQQLAMKMKESSLKAIQERITEKEKSMEEEKNCLLDLISKLEKQLANQNSQMEKERWQLKQEESRLKMERSRLEEERNEFTESSQRERAELEKLKARIQSEQSASASELRNERARLAEERAHFEVDSRLKGEEQERLKTSKYQAELEINSMKAALTEKMNSLERRSHDFREAEDDLAEQRHQLEEKRSQVEREKKVLDKMVHQIHQSSRELIQKFEELEEDKERCRQLLAEAQAKDKDSSQRLEAIVGMMSSNISSGEGPISELHEVGDNTSNNARSLQKHAKFDVQGLLSPEEKHLYENMKNNLIPTPSALTRISGSSSFNPTLWAGNKPNRLGSLQEWRASFLKDMNYLEREKYFVHAVKNMSRVFS